MGRFARRAPRAALSLLAGLLAGAPIAPASVRAQAALEYRPIKPPTGGLAKLPEVLPQKGAETAAAPAGAPAAASPKKKAPRPRAARAGKPTPAKAARKPPAAKPTTTTPPAAPAAVPARNTVEIIRGDRIEERQF